MKYILLIVDTDKMSPDDSAETLKKFANTLGSTNPQIANKAKCLNVGVYMLELKHGLNVLKPFFAAAEVQKVHLQTLFFDDYPAWIITTPK